MSRDDRRSAAPTLVTDGGDPSDGDDSSDGEKSTVHHVVCRDCGMDAIYESKLQAGIDMGKHILTTRHKVVVEEIAGE